MKNDKLKKIVIIALMSASCFIAFRYLRVSVPFTIHLGNVFCLLTALLFGGLNGGICGAIGMGIADLLDPRYTITFPKTVICKMAMALTAGLFARRIFKINETNSKKQLFLSVLIALFVNMLFELVFGYVYYKYLLNMYSDSFTVFFFEKILSTGITSLISLIVTYLLYFPLYNRIKSYL